MPNLAPVELTRSAAGLAPAFLVRTPCQYSAFNIDILLFGNTLLLEIK